MRNLKLTTRSLACLCLILIAPLVGCGSTNKNPYFEDDEGAPRQTGAPHPDNLSLPYVTGTKVRIAVKSDGAAVATTTWQVKSDNPAVLTVDKLDVSGNFVAADCTA